MENKKALWFLTKAPLLYSRYYKSFVSDCQAPNFNFFLEIIYALFYAKNAAFCLLGINRGYTDGHLLQGIEEHLYGVQ